MKIKTGNETSQCMRKRHIAKLYTSAIVLFICLMCFSCQSHKSSSPSEKKQNWDSIASCIQDVDSLQHMIQVFTDAENPAALLATYQKLSDVYRTEFRFAEAMEIHRKKLNLAKKIQDTLKIVESLNELGKYSRRIGEYDQASAYYYDVMLYTIDSANISDTLLQNRVEAINGIGEIFLEQDNWKLADSSFQLALKTEQRMGHTLGMAMSYANLGYVFQKTGQIDSAWIYYERALQYNLEGHFKLGVALSHLRIGELHEIKHEWDLALKEMLIANKMLSGTVEKWHWITSSIAVARVYKSIGDYQNMQKYLEISLKESQEIGAMQHLASIFYIYFEWYKEKGDSQKALANYIHSRRYSDSVINMVKMNQMFNTRLKFSEGTFRTQMESMQEEYNTEKSYFKQIVIALMIVLGIIGVGLTILGFYLHARRKMSEALKRVERMRSDFFTNVTHEFRTPLTVILGFSKQLEEEELPREKLVKIGKLVSYQGSQLLNLVNQLLDYSKIESSVGTPIWCHGNIIAYLSMLVDSFQEYAQSQHDELVFLSKEKAVEMDFVSDYVDKIMRNLLSNAFKYTPKYGKVYITASVEAGKLLVYIADNGPGIADEDKPHLFDPFYQSKDKSVHIGTGIGLSLVYQLVMAMNGSIDVKSSKNEGTVFILKFPLKQTLAEKELFDAYTINVEKIKARLSIQEQDLPEGKKMNDNVPVVLIIEDNMDVAYYVGSQLHERYTLRYARNGKIGLDIANDLIPDMIITDLVMPEMDGFEFCRSVRESDLLMHIPIIVVSALNSEEDRIKGLEAGADVYLSKPFNSDELNERINYLLEQRKKLREKFSGQERSDTEEKKYKEADQQFINKLVDITCSEMSKGNVLVETISERMGLTRQQISRKIQAITGENAVNYLMKIRLNRAKKLLDSPENIMIGEIAAKCGFEDTAYFSRIFKKTYNMTPSQYKKRIK